MPLSFSGMIAVIVFTFTLTLHEFLYAATFITSSAKYPCLLPFADRKGWEKTRNGRANSRLPC